MPSQAANLTALRTDGKKVRAYAAFFTGAVVLTGTVSALTDVGTRTAIPYTTSTGSSANVKRGYRVIVKNSAGDYKAVLSVRASGTISSTSLPVREFSKGTLNLEAGDLIEVRSVIQPGDKLVEADAAFAPDGLAYTDQNENLPPLVCSGGPWAGFVDDGETFATVETEGDNSVSMDAATLTHLWTLPTGVAFAAGSASSDENPTLEANVGEYLVVHTVTDDGNSASWTQYMPIKVFDVNNQPHDIVTEPPTGTVDNGWSCEIELFENATLADIPDDTLCVVFLRETINGVQQSFGSAFSGRSHILMTGYTRRDTIEYENGVDTLRMEIISPLQRYAEILGLSKVGLREAAPDDWSEIAGLTVWRMIVQIARWYTWLTEMHDLLQEIDFEDLNYPAHFLQEQDAIAQMRELTAGLAGRLVCFRNGSFQAQPRLELLDLTERDSKVTTMIVADADTLGYSFERSHTRPVKIVRTRGFIASTTTAGAQPMFGKWPGDAPGSGTVSETVERLIVQNVPVFYELTGRIGADVDRIFVNADGAVFHAPSGTLRLPGYFVFDLYPEFLEFDPSMAANLRDATLSDFRWIIESITYEIGDDGSGETVLQIKAETNGTEGVDDTPPPEAATGLGDIDWTPSGTELGTPAAIPPQVFAGFVFGKDRLALFDNGGILRRTFNFDYASPTYDAQDLSGTVGSTVLRWRLNPNPANRDTAGFLLTPTHLYRVDYVFGTPVVTTLYAFATSSNYRSIDVSFGVGGPGLLVCISSYYSPTGGVKTLTTTTGDFTGLSEVLVASTVAHATIGSPGCAISSRTGAIFTTAFYGTTGGNGNLGTYRSLDGGATWTLLADISSGNEDLAGDIHSPWHDNDDARVLYSGETDTDNAEIPDYRMLFYTLDGTTRISDTSLDAGPHYNRAFGITSSPTNRQRMAFATTNRANTQHRIYTSTNGGTTRTLRDSSNNYTGVALLDDNRGLTWGKNGSIAYTGDFFVNMVSKIGNISTTNEIIGVTG